MCNDLPIPIFCNTGAFSPSPSYFSTSFERPISRGSDTASIDSKNRIKNELSSQYESYENLLMNSKTLDDNDSNIGVDSLKKRKIATEIEGKDEFDYIGINIAYKLRQMNEIQRIQAEYLINIILYNGLSNKLNENTHISIGKTETEKNT